MEKVVAIAKMSPGIVRFYFDSKAAMLIASLKFLAAEFEERLLLPVAALKASPVAALELLVDLYVDPDIASARKVSVWYAFWGEASSRQEYYDICGQKDESFAALVHDLIAALIIDTAQPQLDPDGIALGLIGAMEILWQDFAFRTERDIDRAAARQRCMAYLRSIFPGSFAAPAGDPSARVPTPRAVRRAEPSLDVREREVLFRPAWTVVGHESELLRAGASLAMDTGAERVLVMRAADGVLRAWRNSCPAAPHALLAGRSSTLEGPLQCRWHGLAWSPDDGRSLVPGGVDLQEFDLQSVAGLLFVRAAAGKGSATAGQGTASLANPDAGFATLPPTLEFTGPALEIPVAADWKIVVEQWLQFTARAVDWVPVGSACIEWHVPLASDGAWSARRYRRLASSPLPRRWLWRRQLLAPNQLLEFRGDGLSVSQAVPLAPGRCLVRRLDYAAVPIDDRAHARQYLARRIGAEVRRSVLELAESTQRGVAGLGYELPPDIPGSALAWFHSQLNRT